MPTRIDPAELPTDWWTAEHVAAYLGISASTWRAYVARGQAPAAERKFGKRVSAWQPSTVKAWDDARPRPRN
ncbi:helix-turn-helix transcriptional regulator [Couchioplanes azureus]|uniref:helix-turn-helix transcriptional regulator n=1 Tax=Couchioplanes caeruleus TaxID=56438 RepID=UPI00166F9D5F|nr:helix-turn-helix domain-containing protein [Couchioplanes caeruleus]GGQ88546.1 hypothetical protein GCM10010166_67920 [Couchioplanes caeruleus subsp. azureus]